MKEYYSQLQPENIANLGLQTLVKLTLEEKGAQPHVFKQNGEQLRFPITKTSSSQMQDYRLGLLRWATDPYNPPFNFEGHAYDFFMRHLLSRIYQSNYRIVHTPAAMDFIEKQFMYRFGPSSDLIVEELTAQSPQPLWLIANSISHTQTTESHRALHVPVVTLVGKRFFPDSNQTVFEFATSSNPLDFINQLTLSTGSKIKEALELRKK